MNIFGDLEFFIEIYLRVTRGLKSIRLLTPFFCLASAGTAAEDESVILGLTPVYRRLLLFLNHFYFEHNVRSGAAGLVRRLTE